MGGDLGIDVTAPPPSIMVTSSPAEVSRIDPPNYYEPVMRFLQSRRWQDGRAGWPVPYVRSATYRAAHQFCVRALQRQRDRDEIHTDVDTVEVDDSSTAQSCTVGLDYEKLLDGLRATALNGGDVDRGARKEHVAARDAVEFAQARAAGLEARLSQSAAALGEAKRILAATAQID